MHLSSFGIVPIHVVLPACSSPWGPNANDCCVSKVIWPTCLIFSSLPTWSDPLPACFGICHSTSNSCHRFAQFKEYSLPSIYGEFHVPTGAQRHFCFPVMMLMPQQLERFFSKKSS